MRHFCLLVCVFLVSNSNGLHAQEAKVPDGFVLQVMEPTGGKILRPKAWFFHQGHGETSWLWTISKEDTNDGNAGYETGMRIQTFTGVLEGTGKTPEQYVKDFFVEKKEAASKVHKVCDQTSQGLFRRTCIEVSEGDYRILYSLFWSDSMDMAVISIAGARLDEWDLYAETFDTMGTFELIDMKRFTGDRKEDPAQPPASSSSTEKKNEKERDKDRVKPDDENKSATKE